MLAGVVVKSDQLMKEVPTFLKSIQEFFYQLRTRGKEGGRVFMKVLFMHSYTIEDFTEMLKEEFSKIKLFLKLQPV